jgi:hypothetical protein
LRGAGYISPLADMLGRVALAALALIVWGLCLSIALPYVQTSVERTTEGSKGC